MNISNREFLETIFGDDAPYVYITDFPYDPGNIPDTENLRSWSGDWASRYQLSPEWNQYFTISIFSPDDNGRARRRKGLYLRTPVIVIDDVVEKVPLEQAMLLGTPTYKLETSPGSQQWGYKLDQVCHDRSTIDNLLEGLVARGLVPDGVDPGMKGVTRLVRLPEGFNTKQSKMINGQPWQCRLLEWNPTRTATVKQLATHFGINTDAPRNDARTDGALDMPDHPIMNMVNVKARLSPGRYDITCPFVEDHTRKEDNGCAMFTNDDMSVGFKCHHGHCQELNAGNFISKIDEHLPGSSDRLHNWQVTQMFKDECAGVVSSDVAGGEPVDTDPLDTLSHLAPDDADRSKLAHAIMKTGLTLNMIEQIDVHAKVAAVMGWTKAETKSVVQDLVNNEEVEGLDPESATHFDLAQHYVHSVGPSVTTLGKFYVCNSGLYEEFSPDRLKGLVPPMYNLFTRCQREGDYGGVVASVMRINTDDLFFNHRPNGFACGGFFYAISDVGDVTTEPLTCAHRCHVESPITPDYSASPLWDDHLKRCFAGDTRSEQLLQEVFGAAVFGLAPMMQQAILFLGDGQTGKSTTSRMLQMLIPGLVQCASSPFDWDSDYDRAYIAGKLLNVVGELPQNQVMPDDIFKDVIGGDLFSAREPYGLKFHTVNTAMHLFLSNYLPNTRDSSDAFFRRWAVLEFKHKLERRDPTYEPRLMKELPQIMGWAIRGAQRLIQQNAYTECSEPMMREWEVSQNSVLDFLQDPDAITESEDGMNRSAVYRGYVVWAKEMNRKPVGRNKFFKEIVDKVKQKIIRGDRRICVDLNMRYLT